MINHESGTTSSIVLTPRTYFMIQNKGYETSPLVHPHPGQNLLLRSITIIDFRKKRETERLEIFSIVGYFPDFGNR